uniref:Uncharacterized protein LOC114342292 n=1 Tax=Diabrotica virgifera virgifera TaxID=50390 RepID=A0A6P7GGK4_DIAVI
MVSKFLLFYCISMHVIVHSSAVYNAADESIAVRAKRNLLCREKQYLQKQPMSSELRNFIKRHKRSASSTKSRIKHSIEDNMYVFKDGNIVPLNKITKRNKDNRNNNNTNTNNTIDVRQKGQYKVLPLIVPLTPDPCVESTRTTTAKPAVKTTCIAVTATNTPTSNTPFVLGRHHQPVEEIDVEQEELEEGKQSTEHILSKVIQDVQELIKLQNEPKLDGESTLCNVTGDWDSYAGGMQIRIVRGNQLKTLKATIVPKEPPGEGFLADSDWKVTALMPFQYSYMLAIIALSEKGKRVAMFCGECRSCEGSDTISGYWMIRRKSKNCKDREEANQFISDVLRKNNVRKLQKEHLAVISPTAAHHVANEDNDI